MKVVILEYNAGNTCSVQLALQRCGIKAVISKEASELESADKIIFPGVGAAGSAMAFLRNHQLDQLIPTLQQPVLGICLGMQLLCTSSEEDHTSCLGVFDQPVLHFVGKEKIPHTGWNSVHQLDSALFRNVPEGAYLYFVHSYYVPSCAMAIAETNYIQGFAAALHKNNFYGVQFHPEKSGLAGQQILQNFLSL